MAGLNPTRNLNTQNFEALMTSLFIANDQSIRPNYVGFPVDPDLSTEISVGTPLMYVSESVVNGVVTGDEVTPLTATYAAGEWTLGGNLVTISTGYCGTGDQNIGQIQGAISGVINVANLDFSAVSQTQGETFTLEDFLTLCTNLNAPYIPPQKNSSQAALYLYGINQFVGA